VRTDYKRDNFLGEEQTVLDFKLKRMEIMKKSFALKSFAVLAFLLVFGIACENDDDNGGGAKNEFNDIALSGDAEVPVVETSGTGTFDGTYDQETKILTYTVNWTLGDPTSTVTAMHFHGPATPAESASPVIHIIGFPTTSTGSYSGSTPALTTEQEADLLGGRWYINIHSTVVPAGEIRGNLLQ